MFTVQSELLCRLCGIPSYDTTPIESNLANQINSLLHIHVNINSEEDKLPKGICCNCKSSVDIYWTFYQRVHNVQRDLSTNYCVKNETFSDEDDTLSRQSLEKVVRPRKTVNIRSRNSVKDTISTKDKPSGTKVPRSRVNSKSRLKNCRFKLSKQKKLIDVHFDPDETWSEYPWRCFTCESNFTNLETYNQHPCFKKHKRYFCIDCSKSFIIYNQVITHIKEFHWDRLKAHLLCQCDVCKRWFRSKDEQELHREEEHPDAERRIELEMPSHYSFICQVCGKIYANRKTLRQHAFLHSDKLSYVCSTCGERFHLSNGLYYHRAKYHPEEMLHCDQCGKKYPNKAQLRSHMVSHSKDRPFVCDICHKASKTEYMAKIHRNRHTDEKPYVCDTCGKSFKCRTNLANHRYLHKKAKIHKCINCDKAFKTKTHLINHARQHTGEQPFSCSLCQRKFTCNGNRVKHMRRIHKIFSMETNTDEEKTEGMQAQMDDMILESVNAIMY